MRTIGITGGGGFVGSHFRFLLNENRGSYRALLIEKEDFLDDDKLRSKLAICDTVVHLAGLNRGEEEEIYETNVGLTKKILAGVEQIGSSTKVAFLSSTHNTRDSAYGRSKRDSQKLILDWGIRRNLKTVSVVAPNIFGEFVKPKYNSAVATFCYELSEQKDSSINNSAQIEIVYVRDICRLILNAIGDEDSPNTLFVRGREMKVPDIYDLLKRIRDDYFAGIIPFLADRFELSMFNTFRSYLYPKYFPAALDPKSDKRGSFVEIAKGRIAGQTSFSTTHPGIVRGNHYHSRKIERFCVLQGNAVIKLRKLFTDEIVEYPVSGDKPVFVDMPTFYTHSIENTGDSELLTMFWINEIFDPADPDTFAEPVMR